MREEEEQRLRSENIEVKIILQNNDDNRFDQKKKIKVVIKPKIRHSFTCNLKNKDIDLTKVSYYSVMKFIKIHIILYFTLKDQKISSDFIGSIFDKLIE